MVTRLFEPGERTVTIEVTPAWSRDVALWLRLPHGALDARAWALMLVPERVDPACRFPDVSMHVYQALQWTATVSSGAVEMTTETRWVSRHANGVEVAVETSACSDGRLLASGLTVARVNGEEDGASASATTFGRPAIPQPPDPSGETTRGKHLVIGESDLADFTRLIGDHHPLHSDLAFAHHRGYPNLLVQGHVQILTLMTFAGVPTAGAVEAWFRRPITAGAALAAGAVPQGHREVWTLRHALDEDPATIMSISR